MTREPSKSFGRRGAAANVETHAPREPTGNKTPTRKRSLTISLIGVGAISLGVYGAVDWLDKKLNCEPDPNKPDELICKHSDGPTSRRSASSWRSSSSSYHGLSFGGFGHSGSYHSGGS